MNEAYSSTTTKLENLNDIPLSTPLITLLHTMFTAAGRIAIHAELKPHSGDSRIFVISVGEDTAAATPLVVKIAPTTLIKKEWHAFRQYIPKKIKGITEIVRPPVFLLSAHIGGLIYPLIGGNEYRVESLLNYCHNTELRHIIQDIFEDELFNNLQLLWSRGKLHPHYLLQEHYSHLLPYYLILEEQPPPAGATVHSLDLDDVHTHRFTPDDYVRIRNGRVSSLYPDENAISIKPILNHLGNRILWQPKRDISSYQIDDLLDFPLTGVVRKTRHDQIARYARLLSPGQSDIAAARLQLADSISIPNPLAALDTILHKAIDVRLSCIHGDLNLENILIEHYADPATGRNHIAHLIDFDNSRRDHVLRDPLKLEADIVTRFLPELLIQAGLPPATIHAFYHQLHDATVHGRHVSPHHALQKPFAMLQSLRKLARYYLYNPGDWSEYYNGLTLHLLGALKYRSLDQSPHAPLPKLIAFLGAATTISLLENEQNHLH